MPCFLWNGGVFVRVKHEQVTWRMLSDFSFTVTAQLAAIELRSKVVSKNKNGDIVHRFVKNGYL